MKVLKITFAIISIMITSLTFSQGRLGGGRVGRGRGQGGPPNGNKPNASEILKLLDSNNDELIDKEEAANDERGKIAKDFDIIDANEDGFIDLEELEASLDKSKPKKISVKKLMKEVDKNEDGLLNELEVAAKNKRDLMDCFSDIYSNKDGQLDIEELKVFYFGKDDNDKKRKEKN